MSKITHEIPQQSFEIVRDRIGFILTDELNTQFTTYSNPALDVQVFNERTVPFDKTDVGMVNVMYSQGSFDNIHQGHADHTATYYIDCYQRAKTTDTSRGDVDSMVKLQRLIGVCRAIIENPIYRTFDFEPPFIMHREISQIEIAQPGSMDSTNTRMGRLTLSVRMPETTKLLEAIPWAGSDTQVKLSLTEKGYQYIIES